MRIIIERQGTIARISVDGEIDLSTSERVDQAFSEILGIAPSSLVVDLSKVIFMDSTGLHVLTRLAKACKSERIDIRVDPSAVVARLLHVTGMDGVLPLMNGSRDGETTGAARVAPGQDAALST